MNKPKRTFQKFSCPECHAQLKGVVDSQSEGKQCFKCGREMIRVVDEPQVAPEPSNVGIKPSASRPEATNTTQSDTTTTCSGGGEPPCRSGSPDAATTARIPLESVPSGLAAGDSNLEDSNGEIEPTDPSLPTLSPANPSDATPVELDRATAEPENPISVSKSPQDQTPAKRTEVSIPTTVEEVSSSEFGVVVNETNLPLGGVEVKTIRISDSAPYDSGSDPKSIDPDSNDPGPPDSATPPSELDSCAPSVAANQSDTEEETLDVKAAECHSQNESPIENAGAGGLPQKGPQIVRAISDSKDSDIPSGSPTDTPDEFITSSPASLGITIRESRKTPKGGSLDENGSPADKNENS